MNTLLASDLLNGLLLDFESRESPSMPELDKVLAESEGLHHYRSQNYPRAIESFRQELKACRKPETALLLRLYLANSLLKTGANEEAHSHFFHIWSQRHTFSRDPLNLQFNMALCARRMGNRELAIRHLETVIAGAPDENRPLLSAAWRELARIHEGSDNQQANHCRRKSLEILGPDEGGLVQQIEAISLAFSTDDNEGCLKLLAGIDRAGLSPSQKRRCEIYELLVLARAGEHKRLISRLRMTNTRWTFTPRRPFPAGRWTSTGRPSAGWKRPGSSTARPGASATANCWPAWTSTCARAASSSLISSS
jgi:tetratricopeptide (TPR) repeat protein